jgi:hypothetical protein
VPAGWPIAAKATWRSATAWSSEESGSATAGTNGSYIASIERFGWPCSALSYTFLWERTGMGTGGTTMQGGVVLPPTLAGRIGVWRVPIRPEWPGMAVDCCAYSSVFAALWGLVWSIGWLRRRKRKDVGKCTGCGYDLSGLPVESACPECGKAPPRRT